MIRRRLSGVAVTALVVAVVFGGSLAAAAGARRSASAMERFLAYNRPENAFVVAGDPSFDISAIDRLPGVAASGSGGYVPLAPVGPDGRPLADLVGSINGLLKVAMVGDPHLWARPKVEAGRLDDPGKPLETVIDPELAEREHLGVGSKLRMAAYRPDELGEQISARGVGDPHGPVLEFTVVGIATQPYDIDPANKDSSVVYEGTADMSLNAAFWQTYRDQVAIIEPPDRFRAVWLRDGPSGVADFVAAVHALPGGDRVLATASVSDTRTSAGTTERAISLETASLWALAGLLAAGGIVLVTQLVGRQIRAGGSDLGVLRSIGARPRDLVAIAAAPSVLAACTGAVTAGALAVALSPLTPIGLARQAEIQPGIDLNVAVLLGGAVLIAVSLISIGVLMAVRTVRSLVAPRSPGVSRSLAGRLAAAGAPPAAVVGVRFALDPPRAGATTPTRTASAVAMIGLLAFAGVFVFTRSLDHLRSDPRALGWNWDLVVGNPNITQFNAENDAAVDRDPLVAGWARAEDTGLSVQVNGISAYLAGVDSVRGGVGPLVLTGRAPTAPGELALGHKVLTAAGLSVGQDAQAVIEGVETKMRVVGSLLTNPALNSAMTIGSGAVMTTDALKALLPDNPISGGRYLIELRPGVSIEQAVPELQKTWGRTVLRSQPPVDVANVDRVRSVPFALAGLIGLAATVTLAFVLVATVRVRRRELAILKALGSTSRQIRAMVFWQASTLIALAALVGVPLGLIAGSSAWRWVAGDLGSVEGPRLPIAALVGVVVAALVAGNLIAAWPARAAARTRAAVALRTE